MGPLHDMEPREVVLRHRAGTERLLEMISEATRWLSGFASEPLGIEARGVRWWRRRTGRLS